MEFSVVIPTRNRPERLDSCLEALATQDFPRERFEVLVVDDGGDQALDHVVERFRDRISVTLLGQPHAGPGIARNTGAARAEGRFLAFTDDDCAPATDWLSQLARVLAAHPDDLVGGTTINALVNNVYSEASQALISYLYSYFSANPSRQRFFASNNIAVRAALFRQIGGFDQSFTFTEAAEDRALCDQWIHEGHTMGFVPDAVVWHSHEMRFGSFCRRHFTYGRAAWHLHRRRTRKRQGETMRVEPLKFYADMIRHPFFIKSARRYRLAALLMVTQAMGAAGFFWESLHT